MQSAFGTVVRFGAKARPAPYRRGQLHEAGRFMAAFMARRSRRNPTVASAIRPKLIQHEVELSQCFSLNMRNVELILGRLRDRGRRRERRRVGPALRQAARQHPEAAPTRPGLVSLAASLAQWQLGGHRPSSVRYPCPAKWHAAKCPGACSCTRGSCVAQIGCASGQRVRKRQPLGGSMLLAASPCSTMR